MKDKILIIIIIFELLIISLLAINNFGLKESKNNCKPEECEESNIVEKHIFMCEKSTDKEGFINTLQVQIEADLYGIMTNVTNKTILKYKTKELYEKIKTEAKENDEYVVSYDDSLMHEIRTFKESNIVSENNLQNWYYHYTAFLEDQGYTCEEK